MQIPPKKIVSWVKAHFQYKERKGGSELTICNPFDGDTSFKFNISVEKGVCHCWTGDAWAGPLNPKTNKRDCSFIKFVRIYRKCDYKAALKEVLGGAVDFKLFMQKGKDDSQPQKVVEVALPNGCRELAKSTDVQAMALKKWLGSRGYSEEDIAIADLRTIGMDVIWPYYEFDSMVYWQSRSRLNKQFRFPDASIYDKKGNVIGKTDGTKGDFLYGFDDVMPASTIFIVEAIFGKHTLRYKNKDGEFVDQCVASGGAVLTTKQIAKIKFIGPRKGIFLAPDNDAAGIASIMFNARVLRPLKCPVYYSLPPRFKYTHKGEERVTKDWNEIYQYCHVPKQQIREICESRAKELTDQRYLELSALVSHLSKTKR